MAIGREKLNSRDLAGERTTLGKKICVTGNVVIDTAEKPE